MYDHAGVYFHAYSPTRLPTVLVQKHTKKTAHAQNFGALYTSRLGSYASAARTLDTVLPLPPPLNPAAREMTTAHAICSSFVDGTTV